MSFSLSVTCNNYSSKTVINIFAREESRLRLFENRALGRIFGPKRDKVTGSGENYIMRSLIICTAYQI